MDNSQTTEGWSFVALWYYKKRCTAPLIKDIKTTRYAIQYYFNRELPIGGNPISFSPIDLSQSLCSFSTLESSTFSSWGMSDLNQRGSTRRGIKLGYNGEAALNEKVIVNGKTKIW